MTLTACGGGGSGGGTSSATTGNGSENTTEASPPQQQTKIDPMSMFAADESSEPVTMSNVDMSSLSDSDDDESMNAMLVNMTGTSSP